MFDSGVPGAAVEAAIVWLDRQRLGLSAAERIAFADWLIASPSHVAAFIALNQTQEVVVGAFRRHPRQAALALGQSRRC